MTLSDILSRSFVSANHSWRAMIVLYVSTLLLASVLAFGLQSALLVGFGSSLLPERLLEGFDSDIFNDLTRAHEGFLDPIISQLPWILVFWLVLNSLFGGGIVAALKRGSSDSFAQFFSDCGTYLGRFFLLLLISALLFLIIGSVWMMIVGVLYAAMTAGSITEVPNVVGAVVAAVVFLIPVILIMTIIDYARVRIVADDISSVLSALWEATKFVFRNFFTALSWQLLMLSFLLVLAVLYWFISDVFPMETGFGIFLAFLLQQVSVASRIWARLAMISGQIQLIESRGISAPIAITVGFVPPPATPLPPVPIAPVKASVARKKASARRGARKGKGKRRG